jgi:hypothetical protein
VVSQVARKRQTLKALLSANADALPVHTGKAADLQR